MEVSDKVVKAAQSDYTISCRLAGLSGLVAADVRYHLNCYVKFLRKYSGDSSLARKHPQQMCIERVAEESALV